MRVLIVPLLLAVVAGSACASRQSDSLYRPADESVGNPGGSPLDDEFQQDREQQQHARKMREESLREQERDRDIDDGE